MKIHAPGKLILSGEHAVVYGKPALAMAVNRYVTVKATPQVSPHISFDLSDLDYQDKLSLNSLEHLKTRIKQKYQRFVSGNSKIRDVLQKPVELAQFAFTLFYDAVNIKLTQGVVIRVESNIPMGCGMGSSAATILSIVRAIADHTQTPLSPEMLFELGLEAEKAQHGFSTGLDLRISLHGGCLYVHEGQVHSRPVPNIPMYLVNTGTPESSTGECVETVAHHFKNSSIGDDFAAVTNAMDQGLQQEQSGQVIAAIRENHQLLVKIGIVPSSVQNFVTDIQEVGGVAKVCGAGTVVGEKAGVVLVVADDENALTSLCDRYQYSILPIAGESRGVHVV